MRPKGSAKALEMRRQIAAKLLQEGKGIREVARLVGASPSSVVHLEATLEEGGLETLKAKPYLGRQPRLTAEQVFDHNIRAEEVVAFLRQVHRHLRRKLFVVWDRYSAHHKAARLLSDTVTEWLEVVWLPAYAPKLNPEEMVWNYSKYSDLTNFLPEDVDHLRQAVSASINRMRQKFLLDPFFEQSPCAGQFSPFHSAKSCFWDHNRKSVMSSVGVLPVDRRLCGGYTVVHRCNCTGSHRARQRGEQPIMRTPTRKAAVKQFKHA